MEGWGVFLIVVVLLLLLGGGGYTGYAHYRARRLGLPPPNFNPFSKNKSDSNPTYRAPAPAPGGIQGWVTDKWNALRDRRTAGGAYETTTGGYDGRRSGRGGGARGFGPLDPDEAWDARVDNEASAYYEEQELGLQDPGHGPYGGGGYGNELGVVGVGGIEAGRGRSRSRQRELDDRYDEEVHGGGAKSGSTLNPFGDAAETSNLSLRSVSPRPHEDTSYHGGAVRPAHKKQNSTAGSRGSFESSPTERRSMFTEDV